MTAPEPVCPPDPHDLTLLAQGTHHDPHSVLGAHARPDGTVVRALRPGAESVSVRIGGHDRPLHPVGHDVFSALLPIRDLVDYRLVVTYPGDHVVVTADGYRFLPTLGELDLHLFGEGRHERLWGRARCAPPHVRDPRRQRARDVVRGVGTGGPRRQRARRVRPVGRAHLPATGAGEHRGVGGVRPDVGSAICTSSASTATTAASATRPTRWRSRRRCPRRRRRSSPSPHIGGPTTNGWPPALDSNRAGNR